MSPEVERLLAGQTTVAGKIRALAAAGYKRADIARILGKRYQHVRNVLEESRPAETVAPIGMAEGDAGAFVHDRPKSYRLELRNGSLTLPPEVLAALGAGANGVIIAELDGEFFKLISLPESVRRLQNWVASFAIPSDKLASDELIEDRRREAAQEEEEARAWEAQRRHDD